MRKLLIISYTSSMKDPRVFKEWTFLHNDFDITIAGWKPSIEGVDFVEIRKKFASPKEKALFGLGMLFGNPRPFLDSFQLDREALKGKKFDLVLCNDLYPLPLAFELAQGSPVFWDAHEYYQEEHEDSLLWRKVFKRNVNKIAKKYIPLVVGMSTVSPAIAERYEREYGKKPLLIRNIPLYRDLPPSKNTGKIRLMHQGDAHPARKLESLIDMMKILGSDYELFFMLIAHETYQKKLREMAASMTNIHFVPPVPLNDVSATINQYDLGIFLLPPQNYNFKKCLPNKFFEYMHASLAIAVGPSSEMADLISLCRNGIVSQDFSAESLAASIKKFSRQEIQEMKWASYKAAKTLTAEKDYHELKHNLLRIIEL